MSRNHILGRKQLTKWEFQDKTKKPIEVKVWIELTDGGDVRFLGRAIEKTTQMTITKSLPELYEVMKNFIEGIADIKWQKKLHVEVQGGHNKNDCMILRHGEFGHLSIKYSPVQIGTTSTGGKVHRDKDDGYIDKEWPTVGTGRDGEEYSLIDDTEDNREKLDAIMAGLGRLADQVYKLLNHKAIENTLENLPATPMLPSFPIPGQPT